jgi:SNF2 family DNA or RNA helicase
MGNAMYRKSRDDIAEWLPTMIEIPMPIQLDPPTMALHDLVKTDLSQAIDAALASGARGGSFNLAAHYGHGVPNQTMQAMGQVMSRLLAMRMLSSHPALLKLSADAFDTELSRWGSQYASDLKAAGVLDHLPKSTAKLEALLDQVTEILDGDPRHKVVIFSYFKPMLEMIGNELGRPFVKITGDVSTRDRDAAIVRFNSDPTCRVFLSSDAGAYGVDLNQGSHVLNFDLTWSAGALAQRVARIDRTNSAFDQIVIGYMYGAGTIEERMFNMLQQKQKVARAFLDGDFDPKSSSISLDLESLRQFLDG